jgi:hypothetical protein
MGEFDSSKTRVEPVFNALRATGGDWVRSLLELPTGLTQRAAVPESINLTPSETYWSPKEKPLAPPVALLSWLIRNFDGKVPASDREVEANRAALAHRDPKKIEEALKLLRSDPGPKGWHILEGPTCPDALIVTPDALIVVEGKRTESGPTVDTTWMLGRHQMLRHIDAAYEIRGSREVYGFFIVESLDARLPRVWAKAVSDTVSGEALATSLPHRSGAETAAIAKAFLGAATWAAVCDQFNFDRAIMLERVATAAG